MAAVLVDPWTLWRFLIAGAVLLVGARQDLKFQRIDNGVWLIGGVLGGLFAFAQYGFGVLLAVHLGLAGLIGVGFYVVWTRFHAFIGGADVKAIMALGLILSPWSFLVVTAAVLFAEVYLVLKLLWKPKGRVTRYDLREALKFQVPFVPFLFAGLVAVGTYYFVVAERLAVALI